MKEDYEKIMNNCILYIITTKQNFELIHNKKPLDKELTWIDPFDLTNKNFLKNQITLDGLCYGGKEMAVPPWVVVDAGYCPSALIGFCKKAKDLPKEIRGNFIYNNENNLIPISEYCAIPTITNELFGHTLGSIGNKLGIKGLGTLTKAISLEILRDFGSKFSGIAQYDNISLRVHTKFGKLKIDYPLVPGHSEDKISFKYSMKVPSEKKLLEILSEVPNEKEKPSYYLNPFDYNLLKEMHKKVINAKRAYYILPPGLIIKNGRKLVPIKEEII